MKAVIFDLDETLVDNAQNHLSASLTIMKKYGIVFDGNIGPFVGKRISDFLKEMMKRNKVNKKYFKDIFKQRQGVFLDLVARECNPMPGMKYILDLTKEEGYKMAVASSGSLDYINLCLEKLGIENYFDVVVSGEDLEFGKPHPQTFLVAAQKLGVEPKNCVVLEDANAGVRAAKAAGMKVIAIHYMNNNRTQDLRMADFEVFSLKEIQREHFLELFSFSLITA
jgi:beta-phosphoglucomutase family hydrolase